MNDNKNWEKLNDQIRNVVKDVLESENVKDIGDQMSKTVNAALSEASSQIQKTAGDLKSASKSVIKDFESEFNKSATKHKHNAKQQFEKFQQNYKAQAPNKYHSNTYKNYPSTNPVSQKPATYQPAIRLRKTGSLSGLLQTFFGGIGIALTICQFYLVIAFMGFSNILDNFIFTMLMLLLTGSVFISGRVKRRRIKRAIWYTQLCRNRPYININDLSRLTSKNEKYILKDVKKMLKLGMFPEGHLDPAGTCLMLNQSIYSQYLTLEQERKNRDAEELEAKRIAQTQAQTSEAATPGEPLVQSELNSMTAKGQAFIQKIQDLNVEIEGEVISTKLFRLENLLKEIFERVSKHPQQIPKMQKFMDYYLPTTMKLVQAYSDFGKVSEPGDDILSAKSEIEKTLDTINQAFGEFLNTLYRDTVFDITTDAKVLQSMLAREGLTEDMKTAATTITE